MSTIKDVAQRAGLSATLVSRYLNGKKGLSATSREKIEEAIRELNYRPNGIARSLATQKTHSIGIVVDNICAPFVAPLISGLEAGAAQFDVDNKYNILYCSSNGDLQKKQRHVHYLTQGRVDGLVIYGSLKSEDTIVEQLARSTFPFCLIENDMVNVEANKVVIDNTGGAYRATKHLIDLGYRKIAHMAGNMNLKITLDRMNGYVRALQDNQIAVDSDLIIHPDFSTAAKRAAERTLETRGDRTYFEAGYLETKKLITAGSLPEAIFFATDISAFGAIAALVEASIRVPEDISVVGFDDEHPADYLSTCGPITTMKQPLTEAGSVAIKNLIRHINDPGLPKERIVLDTELIVRSSAVAAR